MSDENMHDRAVRPLLTFLRELFSKSPDPRFVYIQGVDGADTTSKIVIHGDEVFNAAEVEHRPGISIERGDITWRNATMNDNLVEKVGDGSQEVLADFADIQIIAHCFAKSKLVSSHLGTLVGELVHFFKRSIRQLGYHGIDVVAVGKTARYRAKDGSGPEFRSTPVSIKITLKEHATATEK